MLTAQRCASRVQNRFQSHIGSENTWLHCLLILPFTRQGDRGVDGSRGLINPASKPHGHITLTFGQNRMPRRNLQFPRWLARARDRVDEAAPLSLSFAVFCHSLSGNSRGPCIDIDILAVVDPERPLLLLVI
jgi:hypothetical protein